MVRHAVARAGALGRGSLSDLGPSVAWTEGLTWGRAVCRREFFERRTEPIRLVAMLAVPGTNGILGGLLPPRFGLSR